MAVTRGNRPRVMLDTTVFVAGTVWPRFPYEVLQHALHGDFRLVVCPALLAEARRKFSQRFPDFADRFETFLTRLPAEVGQDPSTDDLAAHAFLMRDIKDVPLALAAIQAKVDYFVSDDKDFTSPDQPVHEHLRVLQSGTFLNEVMGRSHEELAVIKIRGWSDLRP